MPTTTKTRFPTRALSPNLNPVSSRYHSTSTHIVCYPGAFTNLEPGEQTIWVRVESPNGPGCYDIIAVDLIVHPIPEAVQPEPLAVCDDEESGSTDDEISIFDLTVKNEEIKGGDNSLSIIWFETPEDEENDLPIADPTAYANTENAQTIVARVTNEWGCSTTVTLTLVVDPVPTPTPAEELEPYTVCDENNDGFGIFDLSTQDQNIINEIGRASCRERVYI